MELVKVKNNEIKINEELFEEIRAFEKEKILMDIKQKKLKEELKEAMLKNNIENWEYVSNNGGVIKATLKKPHYRETIDTKALKQDLPDIAEKYTTSTEVSASILLKIQ